MLENNLNDSCELFMEDVSAYFDGELDESSAEKLKAHLSSCEKCRELYKSLEDLSLVIKESAEEPPSDLHQKIMQRIEAEGSVSQKSGGKILNLNKKLRRSGMWIGAGVAAVICLAVLGSPIFNGGFNGRLDDAKMENLNLYDMEDGSAGYGYSVSMDIEMEDAGKSISYALTDSENEAEIGTVKECTGSTNGKSSISDNVGAIEIDDEEAIEQIQCTESCTSEIPMDTALEFNCDFTPTFMIPRGTLYKAK